MENISTTNSFAKLLIFYNATKRSKLNEADLTKVERIFDSIQALILLNNHHLSFCCRL